VPEALMSREPKALSEVKRRPFAALRDFAFVSRSRSAAGLGFEELPEGIPSLRSEFGGMVLTKAH